MAVADLIRLDPLQLYVPLLLTAGFVGLAELATEAVLMLPDIAGRGAIVGWAEGLAVGALLFLVATIVTPGRIGAIEIVPPLLDPLIGVRQRRMLDLAGLLSCGLLVLGGATAALAVYTRRVGKNDGPARAILLSLVLWGVLPLVALADLYPNENFLLRTHPWGPLPPVLGTAGLGVLFLIAWTLARPRTLPAVDRVDPALRPPVWLLCLLVAAASLSWQTSRIVPNSQERAPRLLGAVGPHVRLHVAPSRESTAR